MDWPSSTAMYGYEKPRGDDEDVNDEEEEDFYGDGKNATNSDDTATGASGVAGSGASFATEPGKVRTLLFG